MIERRNYITREGRDISRVEGTEDLSFVISHFSFVICGMRSVPPAVAGGFRASLIPPAWILASIANPPATAGGTDLTPIDTNDKW